MKRSLVVVTAGLVFAAQPVKADGGWTVSDFVNICVPGSLQPCASVIVQTRWVAPDAGQPGFSEVEMWVRNQQGSNNNWGADNTGGSFITQIGLTAPSIGNVSDFAVETSGTVGEVGDPGDFWGVRSGGLGGQVAFKAGSTRGKQGGILGCDPAEGSTRDYFTTCGTDGEAGYVRFSFTTDENLTDTELGVALKFASIEDGGEDVSVVCRTADGCVSVTPEPSTWILLATGMVGIFGMGWVRRRREDAA